MTWTVDVITAYVLCASLLVVVLSVQLQSILEINTVVSSVNVDMPACRAEPDTADVPVTVIDVPSVGDETVGLPTGVLAAGMLAAAPPLVVVVAGVVAVVGAVVLAPPPLAVVSLPLLISYRL